MTGIFAICDKETVFVRILSEYLRKKYQSDIEVEAFDNTDKLLAVSEQKQIELCLIGESMLTAFQLEQLLKHTDNIIYLSVKRTKDTVFKFQSAEQITKDLIALCMEKKIAFLEEKVNLFHREKIKMIAFYSPVHHILQSSVALTMGQILAKDKKVLYLNFEPYSAFEYLMQKKSQHDMMDIFFYLKEEQGKFRQKLESMTEQVGNLHYIPPVFCYPDMEEIDSSLWQKLLSRIIEESDYEVILLDLTEQIRGVFSLLEVCDEIYCCMTEDGLVQAKTEQYEKLLAHMKKEEILRHTIKCTVPVFEEIPSCAAMFTHSELAKYVKQIMTKAMQKEKERLQNERL